MDEKTHRFTTRLAVVAARALGGPAWSPRQAEDLAEACAHTDDRRDLEFVDVHWGRDDPHRFEWNAINDRAHTSADGYTLSAFNHFIDIRKGAGFFDDYDGYSYGRGSARRGQYQSAAEVAHKWAYLVAAVTGLKVDEGMAWWFGNEYVHAPGHPWYRHCSPSLERYSFPRDRGRYASIASEMKARFPLAAGRSARGRGVPYSVFMPVDNLARYWFDRAVRGPKLDRGALGPVLHAVQDASIPHHAAACNGNWHTQYEEALDEFARRPATRRALARRVPELIAAWDRADPRPPARCLTLRSRRRRPARNWTVSQLVTWVAVQAYGEYAETYGGFRRGFQRHEASMLRLYATAVAMSALILIKASVRRNRPRPRPAGGA